MSTEQVVLRQTGAYLVPALVGAFCVFAAIDAVVEGSKTYAISTTGLMLAVAYAAWLVLLSPSLGVGADGLTIVNPLRVHRIPFGALVNMQVKGLVSVRVQTAGGRDRVFTSWNAPGMTRPPHPQLLGTAVVAAPARTAPSQTLQVVDRFRGPWDREHPAGQAAVATSAWRWRPWLGLVLVAALNIAIRLR